MIFLIIYICLKVMYVGIYKVKYKCIESFQRIINYVRTHWTFKADWFSKKLRIKINRNKIRIFLFNLRSVFWYKLRCRGKNSILFFYYICFWKGKHSQKMFTKISKKTHDRTSQLISHHNHFKIKSHKVYMRNTMNTNEIIKDFLIIF